MDDTDTSHLQSPDATLPASSLANDLKIPLTYSKKKKKKQRSWAALCRVHTRANLKKKRGCGEHRDVWAYIENPFLFLRRRVPPTPGTGFHYVLQEL